MKSSSDQLLLFEGKKTECDALWEAIVEIKESLRKINKKVHGDISELRESTYACNAQVEKLLATKNLLQ
ncbi:MAG: hypothetical protein PHH73_06355 [Candidatus Rickettsiella isopodorum]|nr:hypothetical protein [Candidatus Rickettsiella isopodorum]